MKHNFVKIIDKRLVKAVIGWVVYETIGEVIYNPEVLKMLKIFK